MSSEVYGSIFVRKSIGNGQGENERSIRKEGSVEKARMHGVLEERKCKDMCACHHGGGIHIGG